jgi:hypothetical protein
MPPETCPHCGADIPPNAKACPECGSDEKTGWSEEARHASADIPDEDFDYEEFVKREFGKQQKLVPLGIHWFWWLVAVLILGAMLFFFFR